MSVYRTRHERGGQVESLLELAENWCYLDRSLNLDLQNLGGPHHIRISTTLASTPNQSHTG